MMRLETKSQSSRSCLKPFYVFGFGCYGWSGHVRDEKIKCFFAKLLGLVDNHSYSGISDEAIIADHQIHIEFPQTSWCTQAGRLLQQPPSSAGWNVLYQ